MSALGIGALVALIAAAGVGAGKMSWDKYYNKELDKLLDEAANSPETVFSSEPFWAELTPSQRKSILKEYLVKNNSASNIFGDAYIVDTDRLLSDLENASQMIADYDALGDTPIYETYLNEARDKIADENQSMFEDLDSLLNTQRQLHLEQMDEYNKRLGDISDDYNTLRSNLMSQQYQQNAQLMDTLQSGMERSRRNALESGASAGIRIADNINTLLSVQNKQSAASMETANQLAQMMVQQRNAENSVTDAINASRQNYANVLAEDTANRHSIQLGSEGRAASLADTNYNSAYGSYSNKKANLDNKYSLDNPLYEYRYQGSKYNN
jgi:hypothetical protein